VWILSWGSPETMEDSGELTLESFCHMTQVLSQSKRR
jgi:hypothetical protein